ncbi:polysaccharide deacetylase family protein [Anaerobacillus alkaliphilus]|uniref:Polysaccharide deacetylase family protein n=1 Tax=Anaerobacillus alkaliphilus TaxID=1548597 RepID=A0A4Q0VW99_9BACI|nr:polysaccharide deacetylase family protein [Anaerobacillus alkaliphilus]RXJ02963.1 polysaccharide deacetylase family protein [Anaerobacillus alkaliphilus]
MKRLLSVLIVTFFLISVTGCGWTNSSTEEKNITVLMYHHFAEGEETSVTVDPERLRDQLVTLKEAGYETITERQLADYLNGLEVDMPDKPLVITIDDGYMSNYTIAYPILEELEMHATIYVIVNSRGTTPGYIPHFDWDEAREMVASGWIDIQNHTFDHHFTIETINGKERPVLVGKMVIDGVEETDEQYRERIMEDLRLAKEVIEAELGNEVFTLTYPFGAFNETVIDVATELGHQLMYTVKPGLVKKGDSPYELNRINADGKFTGADLLKEIEKYSK